MSAAEKEDIESIAAGLMRSLESTNRGLTAFLLSLKNSGMSDALAGYRRLQTVLIQQRLWAQSNSRTELEPLFRAIAETASHIDAVLTPYANLMGNLKDLDKITGMDISDSGDESELEKDHKIEATIEAEKDFGFPQRRETAKLLGLLLMHAPISSEALAKLAKTKIEVVGKNIKELVKAGVVSRKGRGRGTVYCLSEGFIEKTLRDLRG